MAFRLGIDTGGTFTDFIWVNEAGQLEIHKEPSTPADPSQAILRGLEQLRVPVSAAIVHGSTVATNALLERRGARTALITTYGFGDVLEIGRQNRSALYALVPAKEPMLVPTDLRFEVNERISSTGEVIVALDPVEVSQLVQRLVAQRVESVAVCLLFSFLAPEHEQQLRHALLTHPDVPNGLHISLSSAILPEYREYERTATTVINAYVAPLMTHYLGRLAAGVAPRPLAIMQSNGGIIGAELAGEEAARTVLSGPAGGVVGARVIAERATAPSDVDLGHLITFDMGGTSTDVALCPGRIPMTAESEIAGLPLRLPIIDIHTVGAGGGSLAYLDVGGALHVGPESAGADPGPACYHAEYSVWRRKMDGHFEPGAATVTDANLVLGRLDAEHFLGGAMRLNLAAARGALASLANQIGADTPEAAAADVVRVANATMERAIRRISVERGYDPRLFTLLAFGGGGPLHACDLADALQIPRVLIPPTPGVLSALGMLAAAPTRNYSQTVMTTITAEKSLPVGWLSERFQRLMEKAVTDLKANGHDTARIDWHLQLDMRYQGQSHELTVSWDPSHSQDDIVPAFHDAHEHRYSYRQLESAVELVTLRLTATIPVAPLQNMNLAPSTAHHSQSFAKTIWYNGNGIEVPVIDRSALLPGELFSGPLVTVQYDTTTWVPPGWHGSVDRLSNVLLCSERP